MWSPTHFYTWGERSLLKNFVTKSGSAQLSAYVTGTLSWNVKGKHGKDEECPQPSGTWASILLVGKLSCYIWLVLIVNLIKPNITSEMGLSSFWWGITLIVSINVWTIILAVSRAIPTQGFLDRVKQKVNQIFVHPALCFTTGTGVLLLGVPDSVASWRWRLQLWTMSQNRHFLS